MPLGPFPPGVPWRFASPVALGSSPGAPAAPLLGDENRQGPFLNRDPRAATMRERRALDLLSAFFNSCVRQGYIVQGDSPDEFRLFLGGFRAARDPTAADDGETVGARPGMIWVNTESREWFVNVYAGAGAADWRQADEGGGGSGLTGTF